MRRTIRPATLVLATALLALAACATPTAPTSGNQLRAAGASHDVAVDTTGRSGYIQPGG